MTKKDYAILACRILALYLFVQAAMMLGSAMSAMFTYGVAALATDSSPDWAEFVSTSLVFVGTLVIPLLLGLGIWRLAPRLGAKMVGSLSNADEPTTLLPGHLTRDGVMEIAFAVFGAYLVIMSLWDVPVRGYHIYMAVKYERDPSLYIVYILGDFIQLGIGLWMMMRARGFVHFFGLARRVGISRGDGQSPSDSAGETAPVPKVMTWLAIAAVIGLALLLAAAAVAVGKWLGDRIVPVPF